MEASQKGIDLIKKFEAFRTNSYQDGGGVWTIGYGSTMWMDGKAVTAGQTITMDGANKLLMWEATNKSHSINGMLGNTVVTQNQFDSLLSFAYNLGVGALSGSTLLKKLKMNPNDPAISYEFSRWNKINIAGKYVISDGLSKRRTLEAANYFAA
jgi:lysozyme